MSTEIRVPQMGESVVEATVGRWAKREGDAVAVGETLVGLETEKVDTEVAADASGVLERILHREGETVHPGDVLGVIAEDGQAAMPAPPAAQQAPPDDARPAAAAGETSAPPGNTLPARLPRTAIEQPGLRA
jgi:2-oxoglutarate dehydrogenase E2 component (dihydrolipoamide succinyltransferase)